MPSKTSNGMGGRAALPCLWALACLFILAACEGWSSRGVPTPLIITATPPQQVIIVTNTPSPSPSPVLAPTLEGANPLSERDQLAARVETQAALQASPTPFITPTPTFTPTPTNTPVTPNALFQGVGGGAVGVSCASNPTGRLGEIFLGNPDLATQIGCPVGEALSVNSAFQNYERGMMLWLSHSSQIYVFYNTQGYQSFSDTWVEGRDPVSVDASPPSGLIEPMRGFGKIWREMGGVQEQLGWATSGENGGSVLIQRFERGEMIFLAQTGQSYILTGNTWALR